MLSSAASGKATRTTVPEEPVARFLDRADALGGKLGPVLLQLPPTLVADPGDETSRGDREHSGAH